ncbi:hypothetical protein [Variovorax sp. dw_308]|uniref:hypothetical protein n=1 Tax=Variovorax sp. dw_308 TaxID=2721546 RepID=UPI001C445C22|nr:hypothetical protein [Variovorax sp. dw_308]
MNGEQYACRRLEPEMHVESPFMFTARAHLVQRRCHRTELGSECAAALVVTYRDTGHISPAAQRLIDLLAKYADGPPL